MRKFFEDFIEKKEKEVSNLRESIKKAETADEVRSLGDTLNSVLGELNEAKEKLAELDVDDERGKVPEGAEQRGGNPIASFTTEPKTEKREENILDSMEYRNAFAKYVRTGSDEDIKEIIKRDAAAGMVITSDIGKLIPNTIMKEFVKTIKSYGQLYSRVRKLNVPGGVEFPIEDLIPTVHWITETTPSGNQSAPEVKTSVSFGYHICEAKIAQSLLAQVVSLDVLEQEIATILAEAFVKEFDLAIVNGTGSGQPTGILNDARVAAGHKIAFTASDLGDWTKIRKKLFAAIPLAYRGEGVMVMTANTWESYFMTLKDSNGNPIGVETFNIQDGATVCKFAGREVILVEPDVLKDFDTATSGDAFAIYFKPSDYAINSNLQLGFKRYFNDDTNKWINKGLCIMDGKLLDVNGVFILTK